MVSNETEIDIGRFVYLPNRDLVAIAIFFKREAIQKVGILHYITSIFVKYNIPIIHLIFSRPSLNKYGKALFFIDVTEKRKIPKELLQEITKSKYVKKVKVIKPILKGLLSDNFFFPVSIGGYRAIILRKPIYEALIKEWQKTYGDTASVFLYHLGYLMGLKAFDDHVKILGDVNHNKLILLNEVLFRDAGFGILKIHVDFKNNSAKVKIYNSFECELFKNEKRNKTASNFVRGMLAGWFTRFFNKEVKALEVKCVARGEPYCEIEIM